MPSRAKMMRKRKSRSSREQMAFMELSSELTRSDKAAQCLQTGGQDKEMEKVMIRSNAADRRGVWALRRRTPTESS